MDEQTRGQLIETAARAIVRMYESHRVGVKVNNDHVQEMAAAVIDALQIEQMDSYAEVVEYEGPLFAFGVLVESPESDTPPGSSTNVPWIPSP